MASARSILLVPHLPTVAAQPDRSEQLRTGAVDRRVFKDVGQYKRLRELSWMHTMIVRDVVRIQSRLESL